MFFLFSALDNVRFCISGCYATLRRASLKLYPFNHINIFQASLAITCINFAILLPKPGFWSYVKYSRPWSRPDYAISLYLVDFIQF